jgi:hypothetical protein
MNPTGDPEMDALRRQQLEKELIRISRNVDRRVAREKAKGKPNASPANANSPGGPSDADGTTNDGTPQKGKRGNKDGTARKCANCGQVGHIKTNRKSVKALVASVSFSCIFCYSHEYHPRPVDLKSEKKGPKPLPPLKNTVDNKRYLKTRDRDETYYQ